jgi:hypothetical protein
MTIKGALILQHTNTFSLQEATEPLVVMFYLAFDAPGRIHPGWIIARSLSASPESKEE